MTSPDVETPRKSRSWALLLVVPVVTGICTVGVRLLLSEGIWDALPLFGGLMVLATLVAGSVAFLLVEKVPQPWRYFGGLALFLLEMALVVLVVAGLWEVLPLGYAGP